MFLVQWSVAAEVCRSSSGTLSLYAVIHLADKFCPSTFEFQLIRVGLPPSTVRAVFTVYRPQRIPKRSTSVAAFVDELGDIITSFAASCADNIVIIGDLNAPGVDGLHIDDELAALFKSFGMMQFVNSPA